MSETQPNTNLINKLFNFQKPEKNKHGNYMFMRKLDEFSDFNELELLEIIKFFHVRVFQENELVFKLKDEGSAFYILTDGKIEVSMNEHKMNFEAPFFFGEEGLFAPEDARYFSVKCLKKSKFLVCYKPDFDLMHLKKPFIATKFLKMLGKRISEKILKLNGEH